MSTKSLELLRVNSKSIHWRSFLLKVSDRFKETIRSPCLFGDLCDPSQRADYVDQASEFPRWFSLGLRLTCAGHRVLTE
jgi:hypothetical protein